MFYSQFILAKKGPLGTIWIAAHLERKLLRNQVAETNIGVTVGHSRCSYSVLMDAEKPDLKQKRTRLVYEKSAPVMSFIESFIARFSQFPSIALVAGETGASKTIARRILHELKSKRSVVEHEEVSVEDDIAPGHLSAWADCPDLVRSNSDSVYLDEENMEGPSMEVEAVATGEYLTNDKDIDIEQEVDTVDVENGLLQHALNDNHIGGDDVLEEKRVKIWGKPALFTLFGEAMQSSREDVNRRVGPLMDVLQQKSSNASRRFHFSDSGCTKSDMSWANTLLSIMPEASIGTGTEARDENVCVDSIEHAPLSNQVQLELNHGVKVTALKSYSVLDWLSVAQLKQELDSMAGPFKNVHDEVKIVRSNNALGYAYAYIYFKTEKSMREALKLKCIFVQHEGLVLKAASLGAEDVAKEDAGSGLFQLIADGIFDRSRQGGTEAFEKVMEALPEMPPRMEEKSLSRKGDMEAFVEVIKASAEMSPCMEQKTLRSIGGAEAFESVIKFSPEMPPRMEEKSLSRKGGTKAFEEVMKASQEISPRMKEKGLRRKGGAKSFKEVMKASPEMSSRIEEKSSSRQGGTEAFKEAMKATVELSGRTEEESFKDQLFRTLRSNSTTERASWQNTIRVQGHIDDNLLCSVTKFFSCFGMLKWYKQKDSTKDNVVLLEFERSADKKTALMVQQFVVDGCVFCMDAASTSNVLWVRLNCAKSVVEYPKKVVDVCKKYGALKCFFQRKSAVLDVHYEAHEWDRANIILKSIKEDDSLRGMGAEIMCQGYQRCDNSEKQKPLHLAKKLVGGANSSL